MESMVYSVSEVAKLLSIGMNSAYTLVAKDDFPKVVIGKKILIPKKALNEWLEKNSRAVGNMKFTSD